MRTMTEKYDISRIPVLIVVFNRPRNARRVAASLRAIRPERIFLACDGPRAGRPGEEQLCREARAAVREAVDWECRIEEKVQPANLGCGRHMTLAITWFFSQVESGIILEDDCLPSPGFFRFAAELLERYRDNQEVMMLSGTALVRLEPPPRHDYEFISFPCCWGWAAWRRSWALMDYDMKDFPEYRRSGKIRERFSSPAVQKRLLELFGKVYTHAPGFDTWDFQWLYACVKNNGLCILPTLNLVSNIGWDASHERIDAVMEMPVEEFSRLRHPETCRRNFELEKIFFDRIYAKAPLYLRAFNKVKKLFTRGKC